MEPSSSSSSSSRISDMELTFEDGPINMASPDADVAISDTEESEDDEDRTFGSKYGAIEHASSKIRIDLESDAETSSFVGEVVKGYESSWKDTFDDSDDESSISDAYSFGGIVNYAKRIDPMNALILFGVGLLLVVAVFTTTGGAAEGSDVVNSANVPMPPDYPPPPPIVSTDIPTAVPTLAPVAKPTTGKPTYQPVPTRAPITYTPTTSKPPTSPPAPYVVTYDGVLSTGQMAAVISNEYSAQKKSLFPYPFLEGNLLMEPYRESMVTIFGATPSCTLEWSLQYHNNDPSLSTNGKTQGLYSTNTFSVTPTKTGQYLLTVKDTCAGTELARTIWVKYVRRELMSLTDADREEFLDTFHKMWEVNTRTGVETYGDKYKSLFYFAVLHNDGGGNGICDEFHAGSGFINNHIYLGMYLEQAMRQINPRVSLHYMEYSKYFESDAFKNRRTNLDGGSWTELMTEKWFGSNDPYTGRILDGRWKDTKIPYLDEQFFSNEMIDTTSTFFPVEEEAWLKVHPVHLTSPYGLLRSPWNYNPSQYLTRFNNMNGIQYQGVATAAKIFFMGSDCAEYQQFIENYAIGQTFETYLTESEDNIHGKVHFTIGGAGGEKALMVDEVLRDKYGFSEEDLLYIARGSQALYKSYIPRKWVTTNPLSCTTDPWQSGKLTTYASPIDGGGPSCTCSEQYMESETKLSDLITLYQIKNANFLYNLEYVDRKDAMNLICSRMAYDGDMASSSAANDPMFWVAHGAIERLFQKVIFSNILADNVYSNPKRNQCSGHTTDGTKKWLAGFYLEDESIDVSALTNAELAAILDPSSEQYRDLINFVYEDSSWDWCDGFDSWFVT